MPEYIEREAVKASILKNCGDFTETDAALIVNEIPTADVVEVRHGEWIKRTEHLYKCSLCGNSAFMSLGGIPCNYCPECGAKMDGKGD